MIKTLEVLDLPSLPRRLALAARRGPFGVLRNGAAWKDALRHHVAARSTAVRSVVAHATGVYFPNRSHSARIAVKKLRYALELAHALDVAHLPQAIRRLRKTQDTLGRAHDRQLLVQRVHQLAAEDPSCTADAHGIVRCLDAEILVLHRRYLELRPELDAICDVGERFVRPSSARRIALVAAGLALPSLVLARRRVPPAADEPDAEDVHVRVRVTSLR